MNLFDLIHTERSLKEIALTKQGGWVGAVEVGDVVNINNESFRVVGPPHYNTTMLRGEIENGHVLWKTDGSRTYYDMLGKLHRDDGPAEIWSGGNVRWYRHGRMHREDGPAAIYHDGAEMWYRNGEYHREDGPAVVLGNGEEFYYLHGKRVNKEDLP